jgi:hypothetical protein
VLADEHIRFDPERIIAVFEAHGVEYVIVGGFGAQAHGASRQTFDIDVVPRSSDDNFGRLAAALRELGARLRVGGMSDDEARQLPVTVDAATLRSFGSSTWTTDAGPVDVLGDLAVTGGRRNYDELLRRAVPRRVHGVVIRLAALDDIVASKELANRDKDREALPELRQLQQRQTST